MTLRKVDTREEGKKLTKKFNSKSELWRIEAVIHDKNKTHKEELVEWT